MFAIRRNCKLNINMEIIPIKTNKVDLKVKFRDQPKSSSLLKKVKNG